LNPVRAGMTHQPEAVTGRRVAVVYQALAHRALVGQNRMAAVARW